MERYIVEGNISVKACILANRRDVYEVIVDEKKLDKDTRYILAKAYERNIPVIKKSKEEINEIASGQTHGGLIAIVGERSYQSLDDCITENCFLALVEGIEDPFNFGYICRSLYAAGCTSILVPSRNWSTEVTTVTKSSAGASEYINIVSSDDLVSLVETMKQHGIKFYCAMRDNCINYTDAQYDTSFCLGFGGEKRGLSKQVLALSDQNIVIEYGNDFKNALNGSSAVSVIAFEALRQRKGM